jgi:Icc protein
MLESAVNKPIIYVLGNHDAWGSTIEIVQKAAYDLSSMSNFIKWLGSTPYIALTKSTAIVGHDGWYDAMGGEPDFSVGMNDWTNMGDFSGQNRGAIVAISRKLAHAATTYTMQAIKAAARYHSNIVVMTHVPPFKSHNQNLPGASWFISKMYGDMLVAAAKAYPAVKFTVIAGHTHIRGNVQIDKNMICLTGFAEYGKPKIETVLEVV